jgi:hypothetical protein
MKLKSIFISILFTITSCSVIVPNNIKYINDDIPEFHKFKNKYQTTKNKSEPYFGDISIKLKTNLIERIAPNISTNKEIAFGIKSKDSIIERKRKFLLGNTINNKFSSIFDPNNSNLFSSTLKPYEGEVKIGNGSFGVAIIDKIQSVFSIGVLSIKIRESSQINLQKVLEKYNATLIYSSERDGKLYANIKIDLDKVDLSKLEELIYMSNSYNQVALKNLEISSLNTAKTLVCLLDMLVNSSDLVELAGVDRLVSSQGRSISPISNQNIYRRK